MSPFTLFFASALFFGGSMLCARAAQAGTAVTLLMVAIGTGLPCLAFALAKGLGPMTPG